MVTLKSSNFYTKYALKSFFKNTQLEDGDEFLLINNDCCDIKEFSIHNRIKIINNEKSFGFAENVNQAINFAIKKKKNLIFLNNDIIFTKDWFIPLKLELKNISIPVSNQLFQYISDCEKLNLIPTMRFDQFNEKYDLLNNIVEKHKKKFKPNQKFQTLLMPFYCFKLPYEIMSNIGYFDKSFGKAGGEDIDYRIRCASKGYEVNFLMDSYLLHFHGKSTWDGIESREEIEERNIIYTKAFKKKWGEEMAQIFLIRNNFSNILSKRSLENTFKHGKFGELIRKLI